MVFYWKAMNKCGCWTFFIKDNDQLTVTYICCSCGVVLHAQISPVSLSTTATRNCTTRQGLGAWNTHGDSENPFNWLNWTSSEYWRHWWRISRRARLALKVLVVGCGALDVQELRTKKTSCQFRKVTPRFQSREEVTAELRIGWLQEQSQPTQNSIKSHKNTQWLKGKWSHSPSEF